MGLVIIQEPESRGGGGGRGLRMANSCDECPLAG